MGSRKIWSIITSSLVLMVSLNGCFTPTSERNRPFDWSKSLEAHQVVKSDEQLKELWSQPNIFFSGDNTGVHLAATRGKVFIIGSLDENKVGGVLAFDGRGGELLWQGVFGSGAAINATSSILYVSMLSTPKDVRAYDVETGELLWEASPPGIRNVLRLYVTDDIVQVNGSNETFFLLRSDTGEVIWDNYGFILPEEKWIERASSI